MNRVLPCVLLVFATTSLAQSRPTLIDAPLDVRVPMSKAQSEALQSDFRQLLARKSGTLVPTASAWKAAVGALRRQDCDVRDECLRQLAVNGASLYALFASIERNAAGTEFTASGRVVNQDGALVRQPVRVVVSAASKTAAVQALTELVRGLALDTLPAVLEPPTAPKTPDVPVAATTPVVTEPPPPPPPLIVTSAPADAPVSGARVAGFVLLGVGLAAGAASAAFGISAAVQRGELPADGRLVDEAQAQQQARVNSFASVSLGTAIGAGVACVAAFALIGASGSSTPPAVTVAPLLGADQLGASVTWSPR